MVCLCIIVAVFPKEGALSSGKAAVEGRWLGTGNRPSAGAAARKAGLKKWGAAIHPLAWYAVISGKGNLGGREGEFSSG